MKPAPILAVFAFSACVPLANWFIENVGVCSGRGPCMVPVLPDLWAPSGVLVVSVVLVLRDYVHRELGPVVAMGLILLGALLSLFVASPHLALASALAFLLSELADFGLYAPLYRRWPARAVLFSGMAGALVDTVVFLWLAFGSLAFMPGQVVGKLWGSVIAATVIRWLALRRVQRRTA